MTEEELKVILAEAIDTESVVPIRCLHGREPADRCSTCNGDNTGVLVAEIERLRGLIKAAEWFAGIGYYDSEAGRPWCESDGKYSFSKVGQGRHLPECPAFHEDGRVK